MARKDYYVAKDTPHPLYRTRMLTAGVPIPLDLSAARLYGKLGVELSDRMPRKPAPPVANATEQRTAANTSAASPDAKPAPKRRKAAAKKK